MGFRFGFRNFLAVVFGLTIDLRWSDELCRLFWRLLTVPVEVLHIHNVLWLDELGSLSTDLGLSALIHTVSVRLILFIENVVHVVNDVSDLDRFRGGELPRDIRHGVYCTAQTRVLVLRWGTAAISAGCLSPES